MCVSCRNIIFTFQLIVILKGHLCAIVYLQPREVWWWEGWSSVVPSRPWGLFNLQQIKVLDIVFYPLHRNLVTFGSPHQGVFGIPECEAEVPAAPDVFLALKYFHSRWEIPFCVSWRANWSRLVHTSLGSRFTSPAKLFPIFRLNRTLWPRRSIGMTPSIRPTSWY